MTRPEKLLVAQQTRAQLEDYLALRSADRRRGEIIMAAAQEQGSAYRSIALVDLSYLFKKNYMAQARDAAPGTAAQATLDQLAGVRESVDHVIVCCDAPPYRRKEIYPEYKAQREAPPDEELSQKRWLLERIDKDGYQIARVKGYEADDVIYTLAKRYFWCEDLRIIASDKDTAQCVTETCRMFVPSVGSRPAEIRGPKEIEAKYGVPPKDMALWLALVGDSSDNIPGVPGIGPKKAAQLIKDCKSLVGIAEALATSDDGGKPSAMWKALADNWEQLQKSTKLTALEEVPLNAGALLEKRAPARLVEDEMGEAAEHVNDDSPDDDSATEGEFIPISGPLSAVTEDLQPLDFDAMWRLAKVLHNSRMYQKYPSPEAIFTVGLKGKELGLKVTTALDCFSVIQGVPRASADLIQALCERDPDCEYFKLIESTPERAVYRIKRRSHDKPLPDFVYTMEDARVAGLSGNANYKKNPAAMLRARCKSSAGRAAFPGATCGLYCPEEFDQ